VPSEVWTELIITELAGGDVGTGDTGALPGVVVAGNVLGATVVVGDGAAAGFGLVDAAGPVDPGAVVVGNGVEVVVVDWLGMELEGAVPSAIFPGLCVDAAPFVPALPQAASTMAAATSRAPPVSRR